MNFKSITWFAVLVAGLTLTACQTEKKTSSKALEPRPAPQVLSTIPSTVTQPPSAEGSEYPQPEMIGYPDGDTIDWRTVPEDFRPTPYREGTRLLPGERLGLIGPIIAEGGKGKNAYIAVYDSAGVLIGGLLKKEANEDPEKLRKLIELALKRSEHQNHFALTKMRQNGALDR